MTDLWRVMEGEATNAPAFIEKFFDACERLRKDPRVQYVPDVKYINVVLENHKIGYIIRPPNLVARESAARAIPVAPPPPSLAERSEALFASSLARSEQLLNEARPREAVQEILWLLETVATAFRDIETRSGKVEGKYFNQIVRNLRITQKNTTLNNILDWITTLHGYLSSPTGGGIRHGMDVNGV
jgi:hypothetical protein